MSPVWLLEIKLLLPTICILLHAVCHCQDTTATTLGNILTTTSLPTSRFGSSTSVPSINETVTTNNASEVPTSTTVTAPILPTIPSCSINETFVTCSSTCENTCGETMEVCQFLCEDPKCQCLEGFYRNSTGACVQGHDCGEHPTRPLGLRTGEPVDQDCSTVICNSQSTCLMGISPNCTAIECDDAGECGECGEVPQCVPNLVIISNTVSSEACPENETYVECSSKCENSCGAVTMECVFECGPPMCQCDEGFYRNSSGSCVLGHDCQFEGNVTEETTNVSIIQGCDMVVCTNNTVCSVLDGKAVCAPNITVVASCKMNEEWRECSTPCEPSCAKPNPICATNCGVPACQCSQDFFRNENGTCVVQEECPTTNHTCGESEQFNECGDPCENTCEEQQKTCSESCTNFNGTCECWEGYVRRNDGKCVLPEDCEAPTSMITAAPGLTTLQTIFGTCGQLTCPSDKLCIMRNGQARCIEKYQPTIPVPGGSTQVPNSATNCADSQILTDCLPQCEDTCHGLPVCHQNFSTTSCVPGCLCKPGYKRDSSCQCVPNNRCFASTQCSENEAWHKCRDCENQCGRTLPENCEHACRSGCACVQGFSRLSTGECIATNFCPT